MARLKESDTLQARFESFIRQEQLWKEDDRLLAALSGGLDSVVLAYLMKGAGVQFSMAHCNFALRGEESLRDEAFCRELADSLGVTLFTNRFDTFGYAYRQGISVEMAARELRYEWFSELVQSHGFGGVVTGHHADDQVETMLLNLVRGTGISGLRGMLPLSGQVIRPLLPFSREEIHRYAVEHGLRWVEDSSNTSVEIIRNRIRHVIIPAMESVNPSFREVALRTARNIRQAEVIYQERIEEVMAPLVTIQQETFRVSIQGLLSIPHRAVYLYEFLSRFGFNRAVADTVNRSLDGISGKRFSSATHRLVRDREFLIIMPVKPGLEEEEGWQYLINKDETIIRQPLHLAITRSQAEEYTILNDTHVAALDFDLLDFPLTLRKWQHGDAFQPLGMNNKRKISDLFTDLKLSLPEKENAWVVVSGEKIAWVVGYRIDHRFRITKATSRVIEVKLLQPVHPDPAEGR
jgi:tRNA(Ile)-lysidine synthase